MGGSGAFWRFVSAVLAMALLWVGYNYVVEGEVERHEDGRIAILLSPAERDLVLAEMRGLLEAVQAVIQGAVDGDMAAVSAAAREVGLSAAQGDAAALMGKLPLDFMALGMGVHKGFDDLAETAEAGGDPIVVLGELGNLMDACTGCHAGYRLGVGQAAPGRNASGG